MRAIRPPGDKSISHRVLLLAPLAHGASRLRGLLAAADVAATARALRKLGVALPEETGREVAETEREGTETGWEETEVIVHGPAVLRDAARALDCGNSGTTARLLTGLLVGAGVSATVDGDASLRSRPMDRVVYPLQAMGGRIRYLERPDRLPLRVEGRATGSLRPLRHRPRVASAQVKSALLLAGLAAGTRVEVLEPGRSRDHTERLLHAMGASIQFGVVGTGARVVLEATPTEALRPLDLRIPGDPSAAAFLIVAALLAGTSLRVEGVCLNPTRLGFLEVVEEMGAQVRIVPRADEAGEPVGDVEVRPRTRRPFSIGGERVPRLLDEVPALTMLAVRTPGTSVLRGAEELRFKESDRLALLARNLERMGVGCRELPDGLEIEGRTEPLEGMVVTDGDHRIAMAFGALSASPGTRISLDDEACASVSFPGFWDALRKVRS